MIGAQGLPRIGRGAGTLIMLAAAGAVAIAVLLITSPTGDGSPAPGEPLAIRAETPRFGTLASLTAAADLVVIGRVTGIREGRVIDSPGAGIRTRLVDLTIERLLAGQLAASTLVMEEEGWLADGTPIIVNGIAPSRAGDLGFYFLFRGRSPAFPHYTLIGEQGRYLVDPEDGSLTGAQGDTGLSQLITALSAAELESLVAQLQTRR